MLASRKENRGETESLGGGCVKGPSDLTDQANTGLILCYRCLWRDSVFNWIDIATSKDYSITNQHLSIPKKVPSSSIPVPARKIYHPVTRRTNH